jgi:ubiquinone/menaquinone biosynthesis C-methylase UbiE
MDFDDPKQRAVFFDVHSGLPREGPGNRAATARALALAGPLPPKARVLDVACGPGMQTLDLADLLPEATITAVDLHPPFVAEVRRRAAARGMAHRVTAATGEMRALAFPPASFDLVWCEGAAYVMGVAEALRAWRPLIEPGGTLALSEAVWLRPDPPDAVRRCWAEAYPAMADVAACRRTVRACGYRLLGDFVLPEEAWWDDYYRPKERRIARLATKYAGDAVAEAVLRECQAGIDDYRAHAAYYGYVFLVMARAD